MILGMYRNNKILDNRLFRLKMDYEIRVAQGVQEIKSSMEKVYFLATEKFVYETQNLRRKIYKTQFF